MLGLNEGGDYKPLWLSSAGSVLVLGSVERSGCRNREAGVGWAQEDHGVGVGVGGCQ